MGNYFCGCQPNYKKIDYLGKGAYGKIYLVEKNKKISVMKSVTNGKAIKNEMNYFQLKLNHNNLIQYNSLYFHHKELFIIMDRYDTDLLEYLSDKGKISEDQTKIYVEQILSALRHLENLNCYHFDLKLENILLNYDQPNQIVLTDFGCMMKIEKDCQQKELKKHTIGTKLYVAPEITCENMICKKSDIWSLGILTYMMLRNARLSNYNEVSIRSSCPNLSENGLDFLLKTIEKDITKRMSIMDCITHPWFNL